MIASDHVDFVSAECSGGVYKGGVDQNAEEIALEIENQKAYDKAYEAYLKKYQKTPKKDRPRFVRPEPKVLPKHQDGKVCIRLMIRGLEESDLDRCSPKNRKFRRLPSKRWIEEIVDKQLDVFAEKWAALLSHEQRRRRFGLDTQIVRRTVASQDKRVAKEHQLHDLELLTSGYCGKGKGRGKTAIAARSSRPGVAMKRKASTGGSYSTGGKKVRKT